MSTTVALQPFAFDPVPLAAASFIARYSSAATRAAYRTHLRLWLVWCTDHDLDPLQATRTHIEVYARELEQRGRAAATVRLELTVITGWYGYLVDDQLLAHSPAGDARAPPRVSQESTRLGLDRNGLGGLLVQAGLAGGTDHALVSLLALNALRVSEACGADIDQLGQSGGHHTLRIIGKGAQPALIPLTARTYRAVALGDRRTRPVSPHTLRHAAIAAALDAGCSLRDVQDYAVTPTRA